MYLLPPEYRWTLTPEYGEFVSTSGIRRTDRWGCDIFLGMKTLQTLWRHPLWKADSLFVSLFVVLCIDATHFHWLFLFCPFNLINAQRSYSDHPGQIARKLFLFYQIAFVSYINKVWLLLLLTLYKYNCTTAYSLGLMRPTDMRTRYWIPQGNEGKGLWGKMAGNEKSKLKPLVYGRVTPKFISPFHNLLPVYQFLD
jgi:hypothetical protein